MWGHIERRSNKMIYIRTVTNVADDENQTTSVCFPVSAIRGFQFSSGVLGMIRYESPYQYVSDDNSDMDGAMLTIPSGSHKTFIENLANEIAFGDKYLITIGDDVTEEYLEGVTNALSIASEVGAD